MTGPETSTDPHCALCAHWYPRDAVETSQQTRSTDPQWLTEAANEVVTLRANDLGASAMDLVRAALPAIREGLAKELEVQRKTLGPELFVVLAADIVRGGAS